MESFASEAGRRSHRRYRPSSSLENAAGKVRGVKVTPALSPSLSAVHSPSRIGCSEDCRLLIVGVQPLFEAIKWAGFAYLAFMALQALRSAAAGRYLPLDDEKNNA